MLKKGEYHYGRDRLKHEAKMNQYKQFLAKQKEKESEKILKTGFLPDLVDFFYCPFA
jgi:hypothetical protein